MTIQVTGSLLDACVLAMLADGDAYGYSLTKNIRKTLDVSESTLYPVMRRLQTDECLTTYDEPYSGRNRRYYSITARGLEKYKDCVVEWETFKKRIDAILAVQFVIAGIHQRIIDKLRQSVHRTILYDMSQTTISFSGRCRCRTNSSRPGSLQVIIGNS